MNSHMISQAFANQNNQSQISAGILSYATEKLNVREGDPLFLLPRLNEQTLLKPALAKRYPEWWVGNELATIIGNKSMTYQNEPILETFLF